jgi:hypothetical protein
MLMIMRLSTFILHLISIVLTKSHLVESTGDAIATQIRSTALAEPGWYSNSHYGRLAPKEQPKG